MAVEDWLPFDDAEFPACWGIRCNCCGATDLHWVRLDSTWRLVDWADRFHYCSPAGADEFEIITEESKLKNTTKRKTQKNVANAKYYTVGVRFLNGSANGIYTYKIRKGAKVHLGQELIADSPSGTVWGVAVVRIDKVPQDNVPGITYKFLTRKAVAL